MKRTHSNLVLATLIALTTTLGCDNSGTPSGNDLAASFKASSSDNFSIDLTSGQQLKDHPHMKGNATGAIGSFSITFTKPLAGSYTGNAIRISDGKTAFCDITLGLNENVEAFVNFNDGTCSILSVTGGTIDGGTSDTKPTSTGGTGGTGGTTTTTTTSTSTGTGGNTGTGGTTTISTGGTTGTTTSVTTCVNTCKEDLTCISKCITTPNGTGGNSGTGGNTTGTGGNTTGTGGNTTGTGGNTSGTGGNTTITTTVTITTCINKCNEDKTCISDCYTQFIGTGGNSGTGGNTTGTGGNTTGTGGNTTGTGGSTSGTGGSSSTPDAGTPDGGIDAIPPATAAGDAWIDVTTSSGDGGLMFLNGASVRLVCATKSYDKTFTTAGQTLKVTGLSPCTYGIVVSMTGYAQKSGSFDITRDLVKQVAIPMTIAATETCGAGNVGDLVKEPDAVLFCNASFLLNGLKYFTSDCAQVVVPPSELTIELTGTSAKLNAATAATAIVPVIGSNDAGVTSGATSVKWYRGKGTANEKSSTFSLVVPPPGC